MKLFLTVVMTAALAQGEWLRNPVAFKLTDRGIGLAAEGSGFAVREELPLSRDVAVEGVFELGDAALSDNWHVAGLAVMEDQRNFWHLALVKAPAGVDFDYTFELAEMLDGQWLAQSSLKVEAAERAAGVQIAPGSRWQLQLVLDEGGITGTVREREGRTVFRQRYAFTARAVICGRPALHSTGLSGTFSELKFSSGAAVAAAAAPGFPPYQSDSFVQQVQAPATGYFYVKQFPDGRWWAIDPLGRGVVVLGVDHTTYWGHWCEKLGYAPYRRKNEVKYPDPAVWEEETLARLKAWGFTMLGAGSQESLWRRGLFHCVHIGIGDQLATFAEEYYITPNESRPCSAFPNVFHPEFEAYCRYMARQHCAPNRNDPWLFGYFIDNELAWWGRGSQQCGLFDAAMKFSGSHTAKQALVALLKRRAGGDIEKFNALWQTRCRSFEDVMQLTGLPASGPAQIEVKHEFLRLAAERYFSIASQAIRDVDPNHMVLGARFAGTGGADPVVWEISGKYSDAVTFNCYPKADLDEGVVYSGFGLDEELIPEHFARFYDYVKKPMLVTEWSFPALDAGVPSVHGAGQRFFTQTGRTAATKLFAETMLALPYLIGYDYFMWVDEPALGISTPFPEDSNYGLVNEEDQPYPLITGMFAALHGDLWKARQALPPVRRSGVKRSALTPMASAMKLKEGSPEAGDAVFTRSGELFTVDNGRLKFEGALGASRFVDKVSLDGRLYGSYNAMVHLTNAQGDNMWRNIQQVTAVNGRMENGCAVVEITGVFKAETAFEITHRLIVPPGSAKFVAEIVRVKNTGDAPLPLQGLYCRFDVAEPSWEEAKTPPNLWSVPENGCWLQPGSGAYYGAISSAKGSGVKISFWKDQSINSFHPDAVYKIEKVLQPGEVFVPAQPVTVIGVLGSGGREGWMQELQNGTALLEKM